MKLIMTAIFTVLALILMMGDFYYLQTSREKLYRAEKILTAIDISILTLRRNEKDFLARKDLKYQEGFMSQATVLLTQIADLIQMLRYEHVRTSQAEQLETAVNQYVTKFQQIVTQQEEIGLHEKDGLYGSLRDASRQLETELAKATEVELTADILMLRRYEKDFMLRRNITYIESFKKGSTGIGAQDCAKRAAE